MDRTGIVYLRLSDDRETMGFGFPKELRDTLVQSEAHELSRPSQPHRLARRS